MESFTREIKTSKPPTAALPELLAGLTEPLSRWGYDLETQSATVLTYAWTYRRWWVWVLVVILFLLGLLFLFVRERALITITLEPSDGGTVVRVTGEGVPKVQAAFEGLEI
jgi:hypothetical protein